jgi:hypothetical protein
MKIKHIFVYYKKIGVGFFRTRLPVRVFGYLFSAPSERLEDYCKYPENDSLPEIEFVGGDIKISFAKTYSSVLLSSVLGCA